MYLFVCLFECIVPLELSRMLAKKFKLSRWVYKEKFKEYKNVHFFMFLKYLNQVLEKPLLQKRTLYFSDEFWGLQLI